MSSGQRSPRPLSHADKDTRIGPRLPVRLIVFFATPHRGMNIDALRTVIKNEPPQRLIDELEPNSGILRDLHSRFRRVSDDIQILSVYELQKTATVVYNVSRAPRHSAASRNTF
jgi:hypothetical protein